MKTIKITTLLLILSAWMWTGCSEDKEEAPEPATLELSGDVTLDWQGNPKEVLVKTNKVSWLATVNEEAQEWCQFTPKRDRLVITSVENYDTISRTATITVAVGDVLKTVSVTQEKGVDPILSVDPGSLFFVWQGEQKKAIVTTNQKNWKAETDQPEWCRLTKAGNSLTINVDRSELKVNRQATVTITAGMAQPVTLQITQSKKENPIVGMSMAFDVVTDFSKSSIYNVWNADKKIAEICYEYIPQLSTQARTTVVYPVGEDGKTDLSNGFVVADGGSLIWDKAENTCTYIPGELTAPITRLYVNNHAILTEVSESANAQVLPFLYKDVEKYEYPMVKIGVQYWMEENLRTKTYADGSAIGTDFTAKAGAWALYSDKVSSVEEATGLLYDWHALNKMAPTGWRVPAKEDWEKLSAYLGKEDGMLLKMSDFWLDEGGNGSNLSGFSAYPGGYRWTNGKFSLGGYLGCWWSTTPGKESDKDAFYFNLSKGAASELIETSKEQGSSVRFLLNE